VQPYATGSVSLGSAEEPYDSDMTHSYRLTEGRLIRYPLIHSEPISNSLGSGMPFIASSIASTSM